MSKLFTSKNELLHKMMILFQKRSYRPKDIPPYIALDIVNEAQFQAMATFAEMQLVQNLEEETNVYSLSTFLSCVLS